MGVHMDVLPIADHPAGSRAVVLPVPHGATRVAVELARCTSARPDVWPDASLELRLSMDAFASRWVEAGTATVIGGIWTLRDGSESQRTRVVFPLPADAVRVRVRLDAPAGVRTGIVAEFV